MHAEYDCSWQSASGAQSGTSPSTIEGLRKLPVLTRTEMRRDPEKSVSADADQNRAPSLTCV